MYLAKGSLVVISVLYLKLFYTKDTLLLVAFLFYIGYLTFEPSFYIIAKLIEVLFYYF